MPGLGKSAAISNIAKNQPPKLNKPNITNQPTETNTHTPILRSLRLSGTSGLIKNAIIGDNVDSKDAILENKKTIYNQVEKYDEDFSQEKLNEKWQLFLSKLETRPALKAAVANPPKINQRTKLILDISNKIVEEEINKIKPEVEGWLKRELKNSNIKLITNIVVITTADGRPLTETELFEKMKEKNPNLQKLISALQLSMV